jgi:cyclohexanecarboxylate-CoA ligase
MLDGQRQPDPELARHFRENGWWRERTILDDFLAEAALHPDRTAIAEYRHDRPCRHALSFGELKMLSDRFALALADYGVKAGDIVALQLPNWWEAAALAIACMRLRAVPNPIVPIFRERELRFILERTAARLLFVPNCFRGFDHAALGRKLRDTIPTLEHILVVDEEGSGAFARDFLSRPLGDVSTIERAPPVGSDICELQFTSGTTGEPKGVLHSYDSFRCSALAFPNCLGLGYDDVCFSASTIGHQTGYLYGMLMPLSMGIKVVFQDVWNAEQLVRVSDDEGLTFMCAATAFVLDTVEAKRRAGHGMAAFRLFISAGAPIPDHVAQMVESELGASLVTMWGMTENGVNTCTRPGDGIEAVSGSDGRPVPWSEVRIVDEFGAPVATGEVGEVEIRSAGQCMGYFGRPDLYAEAETDDGFFRSGDYARLRPDGGIRITGRKKDLIIRGGENIPALEIESLLLARLPIREAAVVGYPDDRLGERACAVIVPAAGPLSLGDVQACLGEAGMAKQYWPERVVNVDALPRTPAGKVKKFVLREQIEAERQVSAA